MGSVEIDELGIVKRKLRVLSIMVDLHGLEIGSCDLAVRTLKLRMAAFLRSWPISPTSFSSSSVCSCGVNFCCDLLRCVLLWLRFSCHGLREREIWNPRFLIWDWEREREIGGESMDYRDIYSIGKERDLIWWVWVYERARWASSGLVLGVAQFRLLLSFLLFSSFIHCSQYKNLNLYVQWS